MAQRDQSQDLEYELLYFDGMGGFSIPIKLRKSNLKQARDKTVAPSRALFRLRQILISGRKALLDNIGYLRNALH
jgi:hypothetical protein